MSRSPDLLDAVKVKHLLLLALGLRLVAAFVSRGYAHSDDHFLIIEVAGQWADGIRVWLDAGVPEKHSLIYPGAHWLLFSGLERVGVTDPQAQMLVVRLLHAVGSMTIVWYGYKLACRFGTARQAKLALLVLATLWLLPHYSVRNLREIVCCWALVPAGYCLVLGLQEPARRLPWIFSGALFGVAIIIRYQVALLPAVAGTMVLLSGRWRQALLLIVGVLPVLAIQGAQDWIVWGRPFASVQAYVEYNVAHRYGYVTGNWLVYVATLVVLLVPPFSLVFLAGMFRDWRRTAFLLVPVLVFLAFHASFPNKQERFVLPVLPFLIVLGTLGAQAWVFKWGPFHRRRFWEGFLVVNAVLLVAFTLSDTKRTPMDTMSMLGREPDYTTFVLETPREYAPLMPRYYSRRWKPYYYVVGPDRTLATLAERLPDDPSKVPTHLVLFGEEDLEARETAARAVWPGLERIGHVEPSFVDSVFLKLNARFNPNDPSFVYRLHAAKPGDPGG